MIYENAIEKSPFIQQMLQEETADINSLQLNHIHEVLIKFENILFTEPEEISQNIKNYERKIYKGFYIFEILNIHTDTVLSDIVENNNVFYSCSVDAVCRVLLVQEQDAFIVKYEKYYLKSFLDNKKINNMANYFNYGVFEIYYNGPLHVIIPKHTEKYAICRILDIQYSQFQESMFAFARVISANQEDIKNIIKKNKDVFIISQ